MPFVRTKGPDVVVRYAGRRLRVTKDWTEVVEDAMEKLLAEASGEIEIQDLSEARVDEEKPRKRKRTRKDDDAAAEAAAPI